MSTKAKVSGAYDSNGSRLEHFLVLDIGIAIINDPHPSKDDRCICHGGDNVLHCGLVVSFVYGIRKCIIRG